MKLPEAVKPGAWGVVGGVVLTMLVGFQGFDWVTSGTANEMANARAQTAVVQAYTPVCVETAEREPAQIVLLSKERKWQRDSFVQKAGWVDSVDQQFRSKVASACGDAAVDAFEAKQAAAAANTSG